MCRFRAFRPRLNSLALVLGMHRARCALGGAVAVDIKRLVKTLMSEGLDWLDRGWTKHLQNKIRACDFHRKPLIFFGADEEI